MIITQLEAKIIDCVTAILGENGLAHKRIDGFKFNPKQLQYALNVAEGFCRFDEKAGKASVNIQAAATGTGKSLGSLIPLLAINTFTGDRVAISTHTKQLQIQLRDKDIPNAVALVAEYTNTPKRIAKVRVGINNYVSTRACMVHRDRLIAKNAKEYAEAIDFLNDLIQWLEQDGAYVGLDVSGILMDYMDLVGCDNLPVGVENHHIQLTHKSLKHEQIKYRNDVFESKTADLLICNHTLVAQHVYRFNTLLDDKENPFKYIVIDEADQFPSAAEMVVGSDLSLHMLVKNTQDAAFANGTVNATQELYDYVANMEIPSSDMMVMGKDETFDALLTEAYNTLQPASVKAREALLKGGLEEEQFINLAYFLDSFEDLKKTYSAFKDSNNRVIINWSPKKKYPSIRISQHHVGKIVSRLFSHTKKDKATQEFDEEGKSLLKTYVDGILFTSATLANPDKAGVPETFDNFSEKIGLLRFCAKGTTEPIHNVQLDLYAVIEPAASFGKMKIVLADARVPSPTKEEMSDDGVIYNTDETFLDYVAMGTKTAMGEGGDCLVLTQSWKDTHSLAQRLSDVPNLVLHQAGEPLANIKKRYLALDNGLMITPSGWAGLDMPGRVKNLIIPRIPFAPIDRQKEALAKEVWLSMGKDLDIFESIKWRKLRYESMMKLIQGIGRGIRTAGDAVTVWILDPRFPRPESLLEVQDPDLLEAVINKSKKYDLFVKCIPKRFQLKSYANARVLLQDGSFFDSVEMV